MPDSSPHTSAFVQVNGVRLNYLDWGGDGPPIVMIHGLGDNPHIFDLLAGHLHGLRPIAYARRGHGQSDGPTGGPYDLDTLTADLAGLVEHLGLRRPHLLGWSMGGNEITRYAGLRPDDVGRLVYLEGAYDWSDPLFVRPFGEQLVRIGPSDADAAGVDTLRSWLRREWLGPMAWPPGLEAYLRDLADTDQPEGVFGQLFQSLATSHRDYTAVRAPAFALYAERFFPAGAGGGAADEFENAVAVPFREASIRRVRAQLPDVTVVHRPDTTHMSIGVHDVEELASRIREFLLPRT